MTLRWRLTLFYVLLLVFLLAAVGLTTLYQMRVSLYGGLDSELRDTYNRFIQLYPRDLSLPLDREQQAWAARIAAGAEAPALEPTIFNEADAQIEQALFYARYQFPNAILQVEQLDFYDQQTLLDALAATEGKPERQNLLKDMQALQAANRRSLATDLNQPIQLSDAQLETLIRSPDARLLVDLPIKERFRSGLTTMRLLAVLTPIRQPSSLTTEGSTLSVVYVARSLESVSHTISSLQRTILLLFLTGLLAAGMGAYWLAGQALQPLRRVQRAAEGIGGQNLTERVPEPGSGDEVQALAQALNGMLSRLEDSFEAQRRFTSDASHELRTPVTAISGHAGYLLRRTSPNEQQQESLRIIQSESERLTNLIASLLQLARSDSGALTLQKAPILSTLFLSDISRELRPLAQAQGTVLTVSGQEVAFEGDPDRLKQVLINLTSNALKAGSKTITLQSQVVLDGQQVRLSVRDDGPGIPKEQLERLFDRFYRLEDSRSRDQGGAGLGLSIARGIVDAHGGKIWLESEVGQGTTAHVQLPVGNVPVLDDEDVP